MFGKWPTRSVTGWATAPGPRPSAASITAAAAIGANLRRPVSADSIACGICVRLQVLIPAAASIAPGRSMATDTLQKAAAVASGEAAVARDQAALAPALASVRPQASNVANSLAAASADSFRCGGRHFFHYSAPR